MYLLALSVMNALKQVLEKPRNEPCLQEQRDALSTSVLCVLAQDSPCVCHSAAADCTTQNAEG